MGKLMTEEMLIRLQTREQWEEELTDEYTRLNPFCELLIHRDGYPTSKLKTRNRVGGISSA